MGIEIISQNNPIRKVCLGLVEFFFGACKARGGKRGSLEARTVTPRSVS